jgi:hypothetical protein
MAPVPGAVNLLDRLRGAFSPGVVLEASAFVCEDPYKTQRALEGIVPALVLAVTHRFHGSSLLSLLLNRLAPLEAVAILGPEAPVMTEWIAAETGIQNESAVSLLSLAAPRVLEALRKRSNPYCRRTVRAWAGCCPRTWRRGCKAGSNSPPVSRLVSCCARKTYPNCATAWNGFSRVRSFSTRTNCGDFCGTRSKSP